MHSACQGAEQLVWGRRHREPLRARRRVATASDASCGRSVAARLAVASAAHAAAVAGAACGAIAACCVAAVRAGCRRLAAAARDVAATAVACDPASSDLAGRLVLPLLPDRMPEERRRCRRGVDRGQVGSCERLPWQSWLCSARRRAEPLVRAHGRVESLRERRRVATAGGAHTAAVASAAHAAAVACCVTAVRARDVAA